jgi:hypothetical protein
MKNEIEGGSGAFPIKSMEGGSMAFPARILLEKQSIHSIDEERV